MATMRAFLVHGWEGSPENHWFPWLKKELEQRGFRVIVPAMPNTSMPKIKAWVSHLKKVVGKLDRETYFIGHSIGCQAILRYLEKENCSGKVPGVIFVAGWFKLAHLEDEEVKEIARPWMDTPIDFAKVKQKTHRITVFLSGNEPYGFVEHNAKLFREKLGATVIIEKNKGHFTGEDGITKVPEVMKAIKEYTK